MGFEPSINQRLLPPTFPRFIRIQSFETTIKALNELLDELNDTFKVFELNTFHSFFDFCLKFSNRNQSVLVRSMLQVNILYYYLKYKI
jgi:N-alpha-acetyltransferase 35, NatC auxiliary subunit